MKILNEILFCNPITNWISIKKTAVEEIFNGSLYGKELISGRNYFFPFSSLFFKAANSSISPKVVFSTSGV